MLGRSPNTISYELSHNEVAAEYIADKAQAKATARRRAANFQGKRIVRDIRLRVFVDKALLKTVNLPKLLLADSKQGLNRSYLMFPEIPSRNISAQHTEDRLNTSSKY
jgi:IS30 family transposase